MGDKINECIIFVGKIEGKRLLGRTRRSWEDNIRMDLQGNRMRSCGLDASGSR
jgi:hypothetical protein